MSSKRRREIDELVGNIYNFIFTVLITMYLGIFHLRLRFELTVYEESEVNVMLVSELFPTTTALMRWDGLP